MVFGARFGYLLRYYADERMFEMLFGFDIGGRSWALTQIGEHAGSGSTVPFGQTVFGVKFATEHVGHRHGAHARTLRRLGLITAHDWLGGFECLDDAQQHISPCGNSCKNSISIGSVLHVSEHIGRGLRSDLKRRRLETASGTE